MKKKLYLAAVITALTMGLTGCNKQLVDLNYNFNYAYVDLPGGEHVEGKASSWRDYEDGDQIQVTIDGVTYLSNSSRIVLVNK